MGERGIISHPEPDPPTESSGVLRSQFRAGELDRTISSRRFLLTCVRWLYIPVLHIALVVMIVGLVLGWGSFFPVLGGAAAILGGIISLVQKAGGIQDDLAELQNERDSVSTAIQSGAKCGIGQIPG